MHGMMSALIARWVALIAMLGLFALVVATSRVPCVPYGLWPTITVAIFCWHICLISESMGHHDSEIMDDRSID
jgi:hypothetical protein